MIHNIAHRGASAYEPENTLRAIERAIEMGATMLELDLHLSSDGYPVVIHDPELARTTDGRGLVSEWTLDQIQRLDAGSGERVPTLSQVINLVRDRAELYLELKGQRTPGAVVEVLRGERFLGQAVVGSFFPWLPQKVKFREPAIRTSLLIGRDNRHVDFIEWALAIGADYVHPCWENGSPTPHKLLGPERIAEIRRHGLGIILWHEERPAELRELVKLDVDGICTNRPDVLTRILQERKDFYDS